MASPSKRARQAVFNPQSLRDLSRKAVNNKLRTDEMDRYIKESLPVTLWRDVEAYYIDDVLECTEVFCMPEEVYDSHIEADLFEDWNSPMKLRTALACRTYPHVRGIPEFAWEQSLVLTQFYRLHMSTPFASHVYRGQCPRYCFDCANILVNDTPGPVRYRHVQRYFSADVLYAESLCDTIRDERMWCYRCFVTPLFRLQEYEREDGDCCSYNVRTWVFGDSDFEESEDQVLNE